MRVEGIRLCLTPRIPGMAGPASFQRRITIGLTRRGVQVVRDLYDDSIDAILVVGGTRNILGLQYLRRRGIPIIQRLDGMNWIHRRAKTGLRHYVKAELNNLLLRTIRRIYADYVVYQSKFAKDWWEREHGTTSKGCAVVHNGVPLDKYTPHGDEEKPIDRSVVLMVEGNLSGGYEVGLEAGVELVRRLSEEMIVELQVAGNAPGVVRSKYDPMDGVAVRWLGLVHPDDIPKLDRSAHLLYSGDPNPACPNAVIEALGCGLPVLAFDTGALPEIVTGDSGIVVPYGSDPWRLEPPDMDSLTHAAKEIISQQSRFREGARTRAEKSFSLDLMVEGYLRAMGEAVE